MSIINSLTGFLLDRLLAPFADPWAALAVAALATAVLMLLVFRYTANPRQTRRAKDRLTARVLELVLFRHDALVSFTAAGRILSANAAYLATLLIPLALGLVPCLLIVIQLSCWFAWRPLAPGETATVEARFRDGFPLFDRAVDLSNTENARVETAGVRVRMPPTVAWRVRAASDGTAPMTIQVADEPAVQKQLVVASTLQKVSPRRTGAGLWQALWSPGEPPLDSASSIVDIDVRYPLRKLYLGDMEVDWVLAFVALTVAFGLVLKRPLRVQI